MKSKEINPIGNFNDWNSALLSELEKGNFTTSVGEQLVFENDNIKVWSIALRSGRQLPFHKHIRNYNWTALTSGKALSYYVTGRIVEIEYDRGDLSFYDHDNKGDFVHNLINIGNENLEFVTVEYKK